MTEILIYGVIGDWWDGLEATRLIPLISAGDDDLHIRINSPGGLVMEGIAIFNAVTREREKGRKVTIHIDGLAASMGSILAMAGEEIIMADNALMMIHNPWDCACGDAIELRRAADRLDQLRDIMVGIYAKQTGLGAAELVPMLDAETWLTASEALEQKFITSINTGEAAAARAAVFDLNQFGFRKVPDSPRIAAMAMSTTRPAFAAAEEKGKDMTKEVIVPPAGSLAVTLTAAEAKTLADQAVAAERDRTEGIRALADKHQLGAEWAAKMVKDNKSLDDARGAALDALAERGDDAGIGHSGPSVITITADARDKWMQGASNSLMQRAGVLGSVQKAAKERGEKVDFDPGEFRGIRNVELARMFLEMSGRRVQTYDRRKIVGMALTAHGMGGMQTTSDFAVLLENVMHKTLLASYSITPDTWSRVCGVGSVGDFRAHNRYIKGSFGTLPDLNEHGEFQNIPIPDGAKETIKASKKGGIIGLSNESIVNDDMDAFSGLATDFGRSAKLTIEVGFFLAMAQNSGFGPTMNDGNPLFHASHNNIAATGGAPSVELFDEIDVLMSSQTDLSANEIVEFPPHVWLGPKKMAGNVKVINGAEYDPDTASKLQKPNKVQGLFSDIVGTARLSGTPWYAFADPAVSPAIEVAFLDGQQEPQLDSEEGWRFDGIEWRVQQAFGIAGVNYRAAARNAGQ